jgi:hypothetical protein
MNARCVNLVTNFFQLLKVEKVRGTNFFLDSTTQVKKVRLDLEQKLGSNPSFSRSNEKT